MSHMPTQFRSRSLNTLTLGELAPADSFIWRHLGPGPSDQLHMLKQLGMCSCSELIEKLVPAAIQLDEAPQIVSACSEQEALAELKQIAVQNQLYRSFIGLGYTNTLLPPVIQRNVLENPGWYTAYTPYQAEISQGRLEALLNFQTLTIELTGLPVASASLLDEATAAAEAMALSKRVHKQAEANLYIVAEDVHPQTLEVLRTRANSMGFQLETTSPERALQHDDVFGVLLQQIGSSGQVHDYSELISKLREKGVITAVACDPMALVLVNPPDADMLFGSAQRFGVPMGYGGPHAAFFACRDEFKRAMPGRIIGLSRDVHGQPAMRMALQTREQHIRREKATSNICTSQVLLANIAGFYAVYHGPHGLRRIARRIHRLTDILARGLLHAGLTLRHSLWFDTLCVEINDKAAVLARAHRHRINLRSDLEDAVGITLDEATTRADINLLYTILTGDEDGLAISSLDREIQNSGPTLPDNLLRHDELLPQAVFRTYHSETEMMRYLHRLEQKDLALNQAMIPLGSCTMKLNAAAELMPITWPEFNAMHPFCPESQAGGYRLLIDQLSDWLKQLTGFAAISMQPNSGAQGEYAGLMAIRRYHDSQGQPQRRTCLVPASAHGTNPASAQMAGMNVVMVACDTHGNIDIEDLTLKLTKVGETLACIMITYPSTHGVYEHNIREVCDRVHEHGGQVYLDGANMNAQMGITSPAHIGADVSHLNLHKTFCIPHGGGGPGMGPIGVKSHLIEFVPGHSTINVSDMSAEGAISAAPYGSPSILPISWMYIRMVGGHGLRQCSEVAILSANYIASRLGQAYPILYRGQNGLVAHECILDIRPLKKSSGISEIDIAKRLIDYGFHAPTMSFPVSGTLMVEPTESETLYELDRFIEAMLAIRAEIDKVEQAEWSLDNNPLVNAPHTQAELLGEWPYPYSKEIAMFPTIAQLQYKYWPTVKRLDDVYGDRHLFCACQPVDNNSENDAE